MEWKNLLNDVNQNVSRTYDDGLQTMLNRMGLEQKRSTAETMLPMIGIFGAGIAVGAALGVLFAPKRGENLRTDLRHSIEDLGRRGKVRANELVDSAQDEVDARAPSSSGSESSAN